MLCSDIPNIGASCSPSEFKKLLFSSTNSSKQHSTITKTVGLGLSRSDTWSSSEKNEYSFFSIFDIKIDFPLSTNFKKQLGNETSDLYDWESAPESTWLNEITTKVEVTTPQHCQTEIYEIIGKCSYITVRPYYLEQVDKCKDITL